MFAPVHLIAQSGSTSAVMFWIGVLITFALFGGAVIFILRKRMLGDEEPQGLLLDDIRKLRDAGEITEAEFDRLKARIVDAMRARDAEKASPTSAPPSTHWVSQRDTATIEAAPGFDLTGEPLPRANPGSESPPEGGKSDAD